MKTRRLGATEFSTSCIGLGGMPLSIAGRPDEAQGVQVIHAALDAGMTFIDTADVYCLDDDDIGHNERLIARALGQRSGDRDHVVVATKGGLRRPKGAWVTDGRPEHLRAACDASLAALGVDCIDLYQLHAPDPQVPFIESVGALAECQRAGKIRHIGLSNVSVPQIEQARSVAEIVSVQNRCNPFDTDSFESGVVEYCASQGIAFLPYSPVGGQRGNVRVAKEPALIELASRHGATPYEICLAWLLAISEVIIPIPGASRVESARSSARAADIELGDDDLALLSERFPEVRL
jgi:aryl-alcohol dehydrogenase-like predicted oxidoreductase